MKRVATYVVLLAALLCISTISWGQATINVVGSLTAFGSVPVGSTSAEQTFSVSGTGFIEFDQITVTAPAGFEVSLTSGAGFGSSVQTLGAEITGNIASTTIYVRFAPSAVQAYSDNVVCSGPSATNVNLAVSGTGTYAEPTAPPTLDSFNPVRATTMKINFTAGTGGSGRIVVVRDTNAVDFVPTDGTTYTAYTNFTAGTGLGTSARCKVVYAGSGTSVIVTNLAANLTHHVAIYEYNGSGSGINYLATAATGNQATTVATALTASTYTIGAAGDFPTIVGAIGELNTSGVGNAVTFSLLDATYSETGASLVVNVTSNAPTASNTVTFKPATGVSSIITISGCTATAGASQYSGFSINGISYITIDGSNTVDGTSKDLTFKMNDATNGRNIIQLFGNSDNITIKNLNLLYQTPMSTSSSTRGVYVNGQSTGVTNTLTIENCSIGDATNTPYYGTGITGYSTGLTYCTNIIVKSSSVYGRIRPIYFYYVGASSTTCEISNNSIYTYGGNNATTTYTIMSNYWGGTVNIFNNRMPTITTNNTVTSGVYGISKLAAQTGAICNIYNNYIGGDLSFIGTGVPTVIALMYLQDNGTYNVYHNTFNYTSISIGTERSCVHISGASAIVTMKNNIFVNRNDIATAYCIWKSNGTLTSNYNDLYVSGASANVGYVGGAAKQTLANWQASGYDANSISGDPLFTSATNLAISVGTGYDAIPPVSNAGTYIASVSADIDGNARDASKPDIGADEFSVNRTLSTSGSLGAGNCDNITVDGSSITTTLAGNVGVSGSLTLTTGNLDLNGYTLTLGSAASLIESAGNTVKGTTGTITTTRSLNAPSSQNVAGLGAELTSGADLGSTVIARGHAVQTGSSNNSILRYYDITPTTNTGLNATLVFHYDESELNSIAEANLVLFKSTDGGSTWVLAGGTVNTSSNTVTLTGIDGFSRWTLGSSGAPLPVELVTLTAVGNRTGATLHWKTETETRCYGFDVERKAISDPWLSDNGWHKIGFVAGAGTSNAPHDYTFVDVKVAPGKYAYRLKQIDNDGSVAYYYSPDVEIGAAPKVLTLGNFPNPFNPVTTIQFSVPADGHATLKVYNIAGQEVAKAFDSPVIAGRYYQAQFDGSRLASGSYFYVLQSGEFRSVKRMMLLK